MKFAVIALIAVILSVPAFAHESAVGSDDVVEMTQNVPSVRIDAYKDPLSGWNLHIMTANFMFDPPGLPNELGHGHAHVYVDGVKIGRAYGEWYYFDLPQGCHDVEVHLNANNHSNYVSGDEFIHATATACAPTTDLAAHDVPRTPDNQYIYIIVLIAGIILGYLFGLKK